MLGLNELVAKVKVSLVGMLKPFDTSLGFVLL